ncbi:MAG: DUF86 domain-containing protein [Candidatus Micrarchaeota archaeon]
MSARIIDKAAELERFADELAGIAPDSYRSYSHDLKAKAACERYFEKIVEACVDLAFLAIKDRGLKLPEDDKQAFSVLADAGHIDASLAARLMEAKGMRNVIAHEYGSVDDELVFTAVTEEIERDARAFVKAMRKLYPLKA